ncbi:hypothetical protein BDY21DRAFT_348784 [Lineolata rhizophorae]|uniref:Uncharacterized protein n=1 Tax=Lineolata rhizophorae TaxID=578093 RepID=A0A6A6NVQ8_9PEZI|nr:hypothetical protein BDY21DRAFT_348784 [Lineolata rhizophorae]
MPRLGQLGMSRRRRAGVGIHDSGGAPPPPGDERTPGYETAPHSSERECPSIMQAAKLKAREFPGMGGGGVEERC